MFSLYIGQHHFRYQMRTHMVFLNDACARPCIEWLTVVLWHDSLMWSYCTFGTHVGFGLQEFRMCKV